MAIEQTAEAAEADGRKLTGIDFVDMRAHLADGYLIKDVLKPSSLVAIVGASGEGKTFCATSLAIAIASGSDWQGRLVRGGLVIYAALEGPASAENRFVAYREHKKISGGIPLRLTPGPINLRDPADAALLVELAKQAQSDHGADPAAIFVDTLNRAMAGGDENSSEEMGSLIFGADLVRRETKATVILVHHCGKDESRGARGHSSLKAALDTEITICTNGDVKVALVTKQRDLPSGTRFAFKLEVVELGRDEEGQPVTTCVVEPTEDGLQNTRRAPTGKNQTALLAALQEWQRANGGADVISHVNLREIGNAQGIGRKRLPEAVEWLVKYGWMLNATGGFRLLPEVSP